MSDLSSAITDLWNRRDEVSPDDADAAATVWAAIDEIESGRVRIAEVDGDDVTVNEWAKYAILLMFRVCGMQTMELGPFEFADRIPLQSDYAARGVRVVPGASARRGAHLGDGVVMMPSYVNVGAFVGSGTMVDTWATVGSCAQIGSNVHLSGGVGIGGVLEPPNAVPVIIGDECMIGSRCVVAEGARVGDGAVLGAGAVLTGSVPVIDAETGDEISRGIVPPWSVAVSATRNRSFPGGDFGLPCVLVIKRLDEGERHAKAALNDILRDHGLTT